jgi:charged multivesicular body protein 6
MLSNHLTLDDEDAVQAELRELQAESVSQKWVTELSVF